MRRRPKDDTRLRSFNRKLRRCMGRWYRVVWNPEAGRLGAKGRWVIQERGRISGAWQHLWSLESAEGAYRPLGAWALAKMAKMDMILAGHGEKGFDRIKSMLDGPRKRRAMEQQTQWAIRFREEILPRFLRWCSAQGMTIKGDKLPPEVAMKAMRSPEALEAFMRSDEAMMSTPVRAVKVFPAATIE